jgi:hypothetical protein
VQEEFRSRRLRSDEQSVPHLRTAACRSCGLHFCGKCCGKTDRANALRWQWLVHRGVCDDHRIVRIDCEAIRGNANCDLFLVFEE